MSRDDSRVVYLHPSDDWYGSDRVAWESARALAGETDLSVLVPTDIVASAPEPLSDRLRGAGITVSRRALPVIRRANLTPWGLVRLLALLLRFAVSAPRAEAYVVNTAALALCVPVLRLRRARVVVHLHETLSRREGLVLGLLLRPASQVLTVSESAHRHLPRSLRDKALVLPNFVDAVEEVPPMPTGPPLRVLFVGRWTPRKGVAELLEVWGGLDPERFHLTVLGGFPVSGARAQLDVEAVQRLPHVELVGEVADPTPHLDGAHVVVIPSLLPEGLPMVGLESLARGRPILGTTLGGLAEQVTPETGWELSTDPATWASTIAGLDVASALAKQEACLRLCRTQFSRERFVTGLVGAVRSA